MSSASNRRLRKKIIPALAKTAARVYGHATF
jgi:hypothetical protein